MPEPGGTASPSHRALRWAVFVLVWAATAVVGVTYLHARLDPWRNYVRRSMPRPPPAAYTPQRAAYWIETLRDDPNLLHSDITPSSQALVDCGLPALEPVLDVVLSEDEELRVIATRTAIEILRRYQARVLGLPELEPSGVYIDWVHEIGRLRADDPPDIRAASVAAWKAWFAEGAAPVE